MKYYCFLALWAGSMVTARCITVPFVAPDRLHAVYDYTSTQSGTKSVKLMLAKGTDRRELASGSTSLKGQVRVTNLTPGDWSLYISVTYDTGRTPPEDSTFTATSCSVTVSSNSVSGRLSFDETFTDPQGLMLNVDLNGASLAVSGGTLKYFAIDGAGKASFQNTVVEINGYGSGNSGEFEFRNCVIRWQNSLKFTAGTNTPGRLTLVDCELHSPLEILAPRPVTLTGNVFADSVLFQGDAWKEVEVARNTFYGLKGLIYQYGDNNSYTWPTTKIPIGPNYFADQYGPNTLQFGVRRGATLHTNAFSMPTGFADKNAAYSSRKKPRDPQLKPSITCNGVRVGQNIAQSNTSISIHDGRPTLVTVDLIPNVPKLEGAKVYARVNGTQYAPAEPVVLYREYTEMEGASSESKSAALAGKLTCNIILPPNLISETSLLGYKYSTVEVYLDTTGIPNYAYTTSTQLLRTITLYAQSPVRPLNLLVVPVRFALTNSAITTNNFRNVTPNVLPTALVLKEFGSALLPLAPNELRVTVGPEVSYDAGQSGWFDSYSQSYALLSLADYLQGQLEQYNATITNSSLPYDRLIGVVAEGLMGSGTEGFNANFSSTVCVVDESKPLAVLHELAHSYGINNLMEEYKKWGTEAYDSGYPLRDTAFVPETTIRLGCLPEYAGFPRIYHFGAEGLTRYLNIMGCSSPVWINPATWSEFQSKLTSALQVSSQNPSSSTPSGIQAASTPALAPLPEGYKRILITGRYSRCGEPWPWDKTILDYALLPGTLTAEDVTGQMPYSLTSENSGKSDNHGIYTYDINANQVWKPIPGIMLADPKPPESSVGFLTQTIDLPPDIKMFKVVLGATPPLLVVDGRLPLQVQVTSPASGAALESPTPIVFKANKTNLTHRLWWRGPGQSEWGPIFGLYRGNSIRLTTDFISQTGVVDLKIRSSDGFNSVENTINGLPLNNRPPRVTILSPKSGATIAGSVLLNALATDPEDGLVTAGTWKSSVQGVLGQGPSLTVSTLTPGMHTLSYEATDGSGAAGQSQVQITVAGTIGSTGGDPGTLMVQPAEWPRPSDRLIVGFTNRLEATPQWASNGYGTARLIVRAPGGADQILTEKSMGDNGENSSIQGFFAPQTEGNHTVKVVIETSQGTTERSWVVTAKTPGVRVVIQPPEAVAAGAQWCLNGSNWLASDITVPSSQLPTWGSAIIGFKPLSGWLTAPTYYVVNERAMSFTIVGQYRTNAGFAPYFDSQPKSVTNALGAYAYFSAYVMAQPSAKYQWFKDGLAITNATGSSYSITQVAATNAGVYTLMASNVNGVAFSSAATLTIPGVTPTDPFQAWAVNNQLPANAQGPSDDPDGDGIPNFVEFALSLNPNAKNSGPLLLADRVVDQNQTYLGFAYLRPKNLPTNLVYEITASTTLSQWESLPTQIVRITDKGSYDEVLVRSSQPISQAQTGFIQFRVRWQ